MLRYNVAELLQAGPGASEVHDVTALRLSLDGGLELARPIEGRVKLINSGRGILVQGQLTTALVEPCSRCLRDAESAITIQLEDEALPSIDIETGLPIADTEQPEALRLDDHHELDLEPAVRDAISLAEPIAPLCRQDCPGLCDTCGADLTTLPGHRHADDDIDPRQAVMARLRDPRS
jgi:uncharacterized protein